MIFERRVWIFIQASTAAMAADSKKETFSVCLFAEEKTSPEKFNLEIRIVVLEDAWEQISEILTLSGVKNGELTFTVDGLLGTRSSKQIESLAAHGRVIWRIPSSILSVGRARFKNHTNVTVDEGSSEGSK